MYLKMKIKCFVSAVAWVRCKNMRHVPVAADGLLHFEAMSNPARCTHTTGDAGRMVIREPDK